MKTPNYHNHKNIAITIVWQQKAPERSVAEIKTKLR